MTPGLLNPLVVTSRIFPAAESCLRRALEALLDLGRHILAKGFGDAPAEYRKVAARLGETGVLAPSEAELFLLCSERLGDLEQVLEGMHRWIREHPERLAPDL